MSSDVLTTAKAGLLFLAVAAAQRLPLPRAWAERLADAYAPIWERSWGRSILKVR